MLMLRKNTSYYDGHWALCAGHVEAGELPLAGLQREAMEEIGITFDLGDAKFVHSMYRTKHDETGDRSDLFFELTKWSGEIVNAEPHKCSELRWFPLNDLPDNIMPHVRIGLDLIQKEIMYSELGVDYDKDVDK